MHSTIVQKVYIKPLTHGLIDVIIALSVAKDNKKPDTRHYAPCQTLYEPRNFIIAHFVNLCNRYFNFGSFAEKPMTAAETKTTRHLRHRAAVDYRGLCLRWRLTDVPPRLCALTLTVIGELRLGLQVHAIASPPFALYQKEVAAKPEVILTKITAAVNYFNIRRDGLAGKMDWPFGRENAQ